MDPIRSLRVGPAPHIAVDHAGRGELVLFVHGIGGNRTNWREQLEHLAPRFHAAAIDVRGWGDSDDYDGPFSLDDVVADLDRVVAHLGHRDGHLVGLSMGGLIAQHTLACRPQLVRSALLVDTTSGPGDDHDAAWVEEFLRLRKKPLLEGAAPADIAPTVARSLVGPNASEAVFERLRASIAALHKQSYMKALDTVSRYRAQLDFAAVRVPVHVLCGEHDALTPPAAARALAARFPAAGVELIPGAGHLSNIENPLAFNAALDAFLAHVAPAAYRAGGAARSGDRR